MKGTHRLWLVLFLFSGAFVFFSFLANTDGKKKEDLVVFYDAGIEEYGVVVDHVTECLEEAGYSVRVHEFDPGDISRFIMSHPDALYLTRDPVDCPLYELLSHDYLLVYVASTETPAGRGGLTGEEFDEIMKRGRGQKTRGTKGLHVLSYPDIGLDRHPVAVDGILPSLYNIRTGTYPKMYRARMHTAKRELFDTGDGDTLLYEFGGWLKSAFSIVAGGDIMLARGTRRYMERYGCTYPFEKIVQEVSRADVSVANLESPISTRGSKFFPFKGIYFRADPSSLQGLVFAGFDVLALANNHALDWGVEAIEDTMTLLKREGILYTGVGQTRQQALEPAIVRVNGTSIAFLSYNCIYPFSVDGGGTRMVTLTLNEERARREIEVVKASHDVLVVLVHGGKEYLMHPEVEKVRLLRRLVDFGADVVLGTHPHVIQDMEVYHGGLIYYSLGNLVFDQNWSVETSRGLLVEISFIGDRPVCCDTRVVQIDHTQAGIMEPDEAKEVLSTLYSERSRYAYAKR
ncbi:MAG: CapA family protein [Spirochaetes bacterium]|nr:CapA family protein [Spirochaetota bacterium]